MTDPSHALREAPRETIPIEMIDATYNDPDDSRPSTHDDLCKGLKA